MRHLLGAAWHCHVGVRRGELGQAARSVEGIWHDRTNHSLGSFDDDQDAARAFDVAARRLRPAGKAHGGRSGTHRQRLNLPTAREEAYAAQQGLPSAEVKSAVAAKATAQAFRSALGGVSWHKQRSRWEAQIRHDGTNHRLGYFNDEQETPGPSMRQRGGCGGKARRTACCDSGRHWQRLNFPTVAEKAFAKGERMPPKQRRAKV